MKLFKLLMMLGVGMSIKAAGLHVGDVAPQFSLPDENGVMRSLPTNQKVVLYFYPKDDTPHCTKEACSLRDAYGHYAEHNIAVFGINYDSPKSHKAFKEKNHLPFSLLSDSRKDVAKKYGLRTGFLGATLGYFFPNRVTFLIDKGVIVAILKNINVSQHADEILKEFGIHD